MQTIGERLQGSSHEGIESLWDARATADSDSHAAEQSEPSRQSRESTGLEDLAAIVLGLHDPTAAWQISAPGRSVVGGNPDQQRSAVSGLPAHHRRTPWQGIAAQATDTVGNPVATSLDDRDVLVLSRPMYLKRRKPRVVSEITRLPPSQRYTTIERSAATRVPPSQRYSKKSDNDRVPPSQRYGQKSDASRVPPSQRYANKDERFTRSKKDRGKKRDDEDDEDDEEEDYPSDEPRQEDDVGEDVIDEGDDRKRLMGSDKIQRAQYKKDNDDLELARMAKDRRKKKRKKAKVEDLGPVEVLLDDTVVVGELAKMLRVGAGEIIKKLMKMGTLATITGSIDADTAEKIALQYDAEVLRAGLDKEVSVSGLGSIEEDNSEAMISRPPVVTIMGHVDHGKTTLLDAMRMANVADNEAGGITQHIGAYNVKMPDGESSITFIDTPGHAAFNEMRERGAKVTDIVILAVAADDGIKRQTQESIKAANAAKVPLIVAFTKSDLKTADPQKVKMELLENEVVLEEFGGDVQGVEVSAKTGSGLEDLFERIALQAEVLELKADPSCAASGYVIESRQAQGKGALATCLISKGTLRVGDIIVAGAQWGRVRILNDENGNDVKDALPSMAVEVIGLDGVPEAGDQVTVVQDEDKARDLAETRTRLKREKLNQAIYAAKLQSEQSVFFQGEGALPTKILDFIVKADVQGSAEALSTSVAELKANDDKLQVITRILRASVGPVSTEDIMLASVSRATILAFNAEVSDKMKSSAEESGIAVKSYDIVYDALDDVEATMNSLLRPPPNKALGELVGSFDVKQIFKVSKLGKVAGCKGIEGYVRVGATIRILRGNIIEYEGRLNTLRSVKEEVDQVDAPNECGISFEDYQKMEPGDRVEVYLRKDQMVNLDEEDDD